jgi:hypothetical protein
LKREVIDSIKNIKTISFYTNEVEFKRFIYNLDDELLLEADIKDSVFNGWVRKYSNAHMIEMRLYENGDLKYVIEFTSKGNIIREYSINLDNINGEYRFYYNRNKVMRIENYFYDKKYGPYFNINKKGEIISFGNASNELSE